MRDAIEDRRADLGLNQDALAREANVSLSTIQRLLRGQRPLPKHERAIETALGWAKGSIHTVLNGGRPTTTDEPDSHSDPEDVTMEELRERLREEIRLNRESMKRNEELLERLDIALGRQHKSA